MPSSALVSRKLAFTRIVLCASLGYLKENRRPTTPEELNAHWIISYAYPMTGDEWTFTGAVYEHGYAYARSQAFYDTTTFWQWMRMPGDIVFATGAVLMAWDFPVKLRPLVHRAAAPAPLGEDALARKEAS